MATDLQSGAPGGSLREQSKVFGLLSVVLFSGGTIASLLIGWWLYRHASRRNSGAAAITVSDARG